MCVVIIWYLGLVRGWVCNDCGDVMESVVTTKEIAIFPYLPTDIT